jgi:branched-chain amino acid transport system substrate-binding protein
MTRALARSAVLLLVLASACTSSPAARSPEPIRIGAVYPLSGSQGPGGRDEFRGVKTAVDLIDASGGVNGAPVTLQPIDVASGDEAPSAIDALANDGVRFVFGSYGTTISQPAATEAARRGMLFWETGAVGSMPPPGDGSTLFFRVAPNGEILGRDAVTFIAKKLAPMLGRAPSSLRFGVLNVRDAYGETVGSGAVRTIRSMGLPYAGRFAYDPNRFDADRLIHRVARAHPDVLFVAAYLDDGIAIRRAMVSQGLPLVANIGTSSSYCMPAFGNRLGAKAVGLFASDKLDGEYVDRSGLTPAGRALLHDARSSFEDHYGDEMSAAALSGFSAAWALLRTVMPSAGDLTPASVAAAAMAARLPVGSLPNGSGLAFGAPDSTAAGSNLRATSVIWEWVAPRQRAVVWPPRFATQAVEPIRIGT